MKKIISSLIVVILILGCIIPAFAATLTSVNATVNSSKVVTITGNISTGSGKQVTVRVIDPNGVLDYLGQTASGSNGSFIFTYKLGNSALDGTYQVEVDGEGVNSTASTTFVFDSVINPGDLDLTNVSISVFAGQIIGTTTSMEYSLNSTDGSNGTWSSCSTGNTTVSFTACKVYIREKGNNTNVRFVATIAPPAAAPSLAYSDSANTITGLNSTFEYKIDNGQWISGEITGDFSGTHTVYVRKKATVSNLPSTIQTIGLTADSTPPPPTQTPNQEVVVAGDKVTIKTTPAIDSAGAASIEITAATLEEADKQAKADERGVKKVKVVIPVVTGANEYKLTLPTAAVSVGNVKDVLEISTDVASLEIPGNMLQSYLTAGVSKVTLSISPADITTMSAADKEKIGNKPVIELKLTADNKQLAWNNPDAPVTVSVDYKPTAEELKNPEHIVVWYIDGTGKIIAVPNARYDVNAGKVVFTTTHFSSYAIAYVQKTFSDIASYTWAKKEIEVMASKGVINGTSENTFNPSADITRADFMLMLVKALGLSAKVDNNFTDISSTAYYAEAVGIAKKLGITTGVGDNKFDPKAKITRQDMMTLINKAMVVADKEMTAGTSSDLDKYTDKTKINAYAAQSIATLVKNGLVKGDGANINPLGNATRAEVAVLIYRIYNK